jgi:hypothetical protein
MASSNHFQSRDFEVLLGAVASSGGDFGIGTDSFWQAEAFVDRQPFKQVSFVAGYRALYHDYDDGSLGTWGFFDIEATYHGPFVGVSFRW